MQFMMVPLPMTAAEKFQEAAYFYNQMIAPVNNTRKFSLQFQCLPFSPLEHDTLFASSIRT
jgi:hypothetical protein